VPLFRVGALLVGPSDSLCCVLKMPLSDPENTHCLKCGVRFDVL